MLPSYGKRTFVKQLINCSNNTQSVAKKRHVHLTILNIFMFVEYEVFGVVTCWLERFDCYCELESLVSELCATSFAATSRFYVCCGCV